MRDSHLVYQIISRSHRGGFFHRIFHGETVMVESEITADYVEFDSDEGITRFMIEGDYHDGLLSAAFLTDNIVAIILRSRMSIDTERVYGDIPKDKRDSIRAGLTEFLKSKGFKPDEDGNFVYVMKGHGDQEEEE